MPWFRTRPSFPAEIFSPVSLPRPQLADESASQVSLPRVGWEGFQKGAGARPGRGSVTSYSHRRADRWFLPCARAAHVLSKTQIPIHRVYCCLKHGQKKITVRRHGFLLGLFPTCLHSPWAHDESDTR